MKKFEPGEVVIAIPGLTWGTSNTLFSFLDRIKLDFHQQSITLFYYAWESELNKVWTKELISVCKVKDINLKLITEPYNSRRTLDFYHSIFKYLDIHAPDTLPATILRTYQTFYMLHRLSEMINSYNPNAYIIKLRSLLHFNEVKLKQLYDNYLNYHLITRVYPLHNGINLKDYILTDDASRYYTSEKIFSTSCRTLHKIFKDYSLIAESIADIIKYFAYLSSYALNTVNDLAEFINSEYYTNDGGQTFDQILTRLQPNVPVLPFNFYSFIDWIDYKSPSYDISIRGQNLVQSPYLDKNYKYFIVS